MKITVIGSGYVGLVTGACLADAGNSVVCLDVDQKKIAELQAGRIPIHEPMLDTLIDRCVKRGTLSFTTNAETATRHGDIQIIAVGTPPDEDGSADLNYVLKVADTIGQMIQKRTIVITKSTVPVGTGNKVRHAINQALNKRGLSIDFSVVSNPEFLREGDAIRDFKYPSRVVIGTNEKWALAVMKKLYEPFTSEDRPVIEMDLASAEMAKYAANAMLATRISFMNELANLAEHLGADIEAVRVAIGTDPRIGPQFLRPGCGYGGSCFPKDVRALIRTAEKDAGQSLSILNAVEQVNELQKSTLVNKIKKRFNNDLYGKTIAIWGLAFKPDTDDMREAPSLAIIDGLLHAGATINAFDPISMDEARLRFTPPASGLNFAATALDALTNADALVLITEWSEFRHVALDEIISRLKTKIVFDGRNIWHPDEMAATGIEYYSVGRPNI